MDDISADTADFPLPPSLESRREQMFPKLAPAEITRLRRFGTVHTWQPGEILFDPSGADWACSFCCAGAS